MPSIVHAGAHLEVAIGGVVPETRIERKRVRAIDGAAAHAVDRRRLLNGQGRLDRQRRRARRQNRRQVGAAAARIVRGRSARSFG